MESPSGRLKALDICRGLTIASMILVNNSSYIRGAYPPLLHAAWDGWTFADTIFPSFLWIVGFSMTLSTARRQGGGADSGRLLRNAMRRALMLFVCGLLLQPLPYLAIENVHLTGVLQKIAFCYFAAFVIYLWTPGRMLVAWIVGLQAVYLALMLRYPVPGCADVHWTRECNLAGFVNEWMRNSYAWLVPRQNNPDGVVTFLPATTTVLIGALSGRLFHHYTAPAIRVLGSMGIGCVLLLCGLLLASWIPINKQLWTTSYVVAMAGLTSLCFGACYWLAQSRTAARWLKPFEIFGLNAIAAYAVSVLGMNIPKVHVLGMSLDEACLRVVDPANASLLYALANVAGVYLVVHWMYRRHWFLKL